jgi:hypothetical protein
VGFWSALTFKNVLKSMKPFLIALGEKYPHVETFSVLSREMIEPFLVLPSWVDSKGRMHPISAYKRYDTVSISKGGEKEEETEIWGCLRGIS